MQKTVFFAPHGTNYMHTVISFGSTNSLEIFTEIKYYLQDEWMNLCLDKGIQNLDDNGTKIISKDNLAWA